MEPLTKKQKEILDFAIGFINENGYAPSYREIGEYFKLSSVATVAEHINTLKTKGYLENSDPGCARSIQICNEAKEENLNSEVLLLGCIAAGKPIEAVRTHETLNIPTDMMGPNVFALKVRGDSMIEDGILNGDYVIIEQCHYASNGDIVVALLNKNEVTLKRYYKRNNYIYLEPANKKYKAIRTRNAKIQGKVKGVIRKF